MKHERFYTATDRLMHAFMTETLLHGSCSKCAIGSICGTIDWTAYHTFFRTGNIQFATGRRAIKATGYKPVEIYQIEAAYEDRQYTLLTKKGNVEEIVFTYDQNGQLASLRDMRMRNEDPDSFLGLCRAFDVMVDLEDWTEEENKVDLIGMLQNPQVFDKSINDILLGL